MFRSPTIEVLCRKLHYLHNLLIYEPSNKCKCLKNIPALIPLGRVGTAYDHFQSSCCSYDL